MARPRPVPRPASASPPPLELRTAEELAAREAAADSTPLDPLEPTADWTLPELYFRVQRPLLVAEGLKEKTLYEYDNAVAKWPQFTDNLPLRQLAVGHCGKQELAKFRDAAAALPGRSGCPQASGYTVRKLQRSIQTLLDWSGPPGTMRRNRDRDALGLIDRVPYVKLVKVQKPLPRDLSDDELQRLIAATKKMKSPRISPVGAPQWWLSLLIVVYYTTCRRQAILEVTFADVTRDLFGPVLRVWMRLNKGGYWRDYRLTPDAVAAIDAMRTPETQPTDRIFPFPNWPSKGATGNFHARYRRLMKVAGIARGKTGTNDLRQTLATRLSVAHGVNTAQKLMGHGAMTTTLIYVREAAEASAASTQIPPLMPSPAPAAREGNRPSPIIVAE